MKSRACMTVFLATLGLVTGTAAYGGDTLTQQSVKAMARDIELAAARRDVAGVLRYVAPEVKVTAKVIGPSGEEVVTMGYDAYKDMLPQLWLIASHYTYKQEALDIKLSADKSEATISALVRESYVISGEAGTTLAREVSTVRLIGGRPMLVRLVVEHVE